VRVSVQVTKEEAEHCMAHEPYKLELVRDILARDPGATITLYHIGERSPRRRLRRLACPVSDLRIIDEHDQSVPLLSLQFRSAALPCRRKGQRAALV
jgi:threonyl-tRNA synthetase